MTTTDQAAKEAVQLLINQLESARDEIDAWINVARNETLRELDKELYDHTDGYGKIANFHIINNIPAVIEDMEAEWYDLDRAGNEDEAAVLANKLDKADYIERDLARQARRRVLEETIGYYNS